MMRVPAGIQRHAKAPFPWIVEFRTLNGLGTATPPGPLRRRGFRPSDCDRVLLSFLRLANDLSPVSAHDPTDHARARARVRLARYVG
jgi:hypothetical protein